MYNKFEILYENKMEEENPDPVSKKAIHYKEYKEIYKIADSKDNINSWVFF